MPSEHRQTQERAVGRKTLRITQISPRLSGEEEREKRAFLEKRLYEVFAKYRPGGEESRP